LESGSSKDRSRETHALKSEIARQLQLDRKTVRGILDATVAAVRARGARGHAARRAYELSAKPRAPGDKKQI